MRRSGGGARSLAAAPSEKDTISCGNPFDWKRERTAALSHSPGARRGRVSLLPQTPLKACGLPGMESVRKGFFSEGKLPPKKSAAGTNKQPFRRTDRRDRLEAERAAPSRALWGCSGGEFGFRRYRGYSFKDFGFRRRGRGALRSPTPLGNGVREGRALSCSPEAVQAESSVSDDTGAILLRVFVSGDAGVGRSAPLHPPRERGTRGCTPSRALPELFWRRVRFPPKQELFF